MMTKNERLKRSILDNINNGVFKNSFDDLFSLLAYEIARFAAKNKLFKKKKVSNYFWNQYCVNNHDIVFSNSNYEFVLSWYLDNLDQTNETLNKILVEDYPDKFIKSIRANRSFLNEEFFNKLQHYDWSSKHSIHILAWKELHENHTEKQAAIDKAWSLIDELDLNKVLTGLIYWIDSRFFKDFDDVNHEKLRSIYNYAMSYVLSKQSKIKAIKEEKFEEQFVKFIQSDKYKHVDLFLNEIRDWLEFESTYLSSYCFDDNFQPKMINGHLSFEFLSNEKHENWFKDTERYLVNSKRYYADAIQYYQDKASELEIPRGKTEVDKNINHYCIIKNLQSNMFLGDLHIEDLKFADHSVNINKLVGCLLIYSANRHNRYVEQMLRYTKRHSWLESFGLTFLLSMKQGQTNSPMPYMYQTKDDLFSIYRDAIDKEMLEDEEIRDLITHFSYELKPKSDFNPFSIKYDVLETPFLKIDNYIFTSTSLFSSNEWFYSIGQRGLNIYANKYHKKKQGETSAEMEKCLGEEFENHGWKVKVISQGESNNIDGDIDLFVNDDETQLLIQLKRTKFKLDLAANYKDTLETDLKASGQLNEAVKSLESKPLPDMEILNNHEKWIVTTSFEGILTEIDDCRKVNYFDLLWALRKKKFISLNELKVYIENDGPYRDCMHYLKALN